MIINVERNIRLFNDAMNMESYDKESVKNFKKTLSSGDKTYFNDALRLAEWAKEYDIEKAILESLKNKMSLPGAKAVLCMIRSWQREINNFLADGFCISGESDLFNHVRKSLDLLKSREESYVLLEKYRKEFEEWHESKLKDMELRVALKLVDKIKNLSSINFLGFECVKGLQFIRKEAVEKISAYWYTKNKSWNITVYEKKDSDDEKRTVYHTLTPKFTNKEIAFFVTNELMKLINVSTEPEEDEYKVLWDDAKSAPIVAN